jgi:hypothetical protein
MESDGQIGKEVLANPDKVKMLLHWRGKFHCFRLEVN